MTDILQHHVRCPDCNTESPFTLYRSLNVTLNPAEKQTLLAGQLFRFKCPNCGAATQVLYPMLYHDMQRKLMIWMIPDDGSGASPPAEPVGPGLPKGGAMEGYRTRSVNSANELLEKVLIFDAELDDLTLEMLKIIIAFQAEAAGEPKDAKIFFAKAGHDASGAEQLVFAVVTPRGTRNAAIAREPMYSSSALAAAEMSSRHPPPGNWPRVDAVYLKRIMDLDIRERHP